MNSTLSYILIAILVIIIVHMVFTTLNGKCMREKMTVNPQNDSGVKDNDSNDKLSYASVDGSESMFDKMRRVEDSDASLAVHDNASDMSSVSDSEDKSHPADFGLIVQNQSKTCPTSTNNAEVSRYINEYALNGRNICSNDGDKKYTKEDLDVYRHNFIDFRNNTGHSSSTGENLVEKINELYNTGNSDKAKIHEGKTISDVFNGLTAQDRQINNSMCVIKPEIDRSTLSTHYKKDSANGGSYTNFNLIYESDKNNVNNGGVFYGNVEGYDDSIDSSMSLDFTCTSTR